MSYFRTKGKIGLVLTLFGWASLFCCCLATSVNAKVVPAAFDSYQPASDQHASCHALDTQRTSSAKTEDCDCDQQFSTIFDQAVKDLSLVGAPVPLVLHAIDQMHLSASGKRFSLVFFSPSHLEGTPLYLQFSNLRI